MLGNAFVAIFALAALWIFSGEAPRAVEGQTRPLAGIVAGADTARVQFARGKGARRDLMVGRRTDSTGKSEFVVVTGKPCSSVITTVRPLGPAVSVSTSSPQAHGSLSPGAALPLQVAVQATAQASGYVAVDVRCETSTGTTTTTQAFQVGSANTPYANQIPHSGAHVGMVGGKPAIVFTATLK